MKYELGWTKGCLGLVQRSLERSTHVVEWEVGGVIITFFAMIVMIIGGFILGAIYSIQSWNFFNWLGGLILTKLKMHDRARGKRSGLCHLRPEIMLFLRRRSEFNDSGFTGWSNWV